MMRSRDSVRSFLPPSLRAASLHAASFYAAALGFALLSLACTSLSRPLPATSAGPSSAEPTEAAASRGAPGTSSAGQTTEPRPRRDGAPPPAAVRKAGETLLGPVVRIDAGGSAQAGETAVAAAGDVLVAAWNDQREPGDSDYWRLAGAISRDGGATWSEGLVRPDQSTASTYEGDPTATVDPRTGTLWIGGVRFFQEGSVYVARLRPGASAFDPPVIARTGNGSFYDKPLLAAGPAPGNPATTRLYAASSAGLQVSSDLGATWTHRPSYPEFEVSPQPRVAADGRLYITSWDFGANLVVRRSVDAGQTFAGPFQAATRADFWPTSDGTRVPGDLRHPPVPAFALAPDGTLYLAFCDTASVVPGDIDLDIYLTHSVDGGTTWSTPRSLHAGVGGDQIFPWIEVDANGRLHMAHVDSRFHPQIDSDPVGLFDVVYSHSDDGGASWSETRVTETSTSTAAVSWVGGYEFMGDYLGLAVHPDGDVTLVYAEAPAGGDLDIVSRRLTPALFVDGFESQGLGAWSAAVP